VILRPSNTRGILTSESWIQSRRTFSNNSYRDPRYKNFGSLCAINDDILWPGYTIAKHEHKNLDILGYMIEGELEHWDSLENTSRANPGQVQHMWCGRSIWHTEKCLSDKPARYMQIWITQDAKNTEPFYELYNRETLEFSKLNIRMNTTMQVFAGILNNEYTVSKSYLYVISGKCQIDGQTLYEGDGAELNNDTIVPIDSPHLILFVI